MNNNRRTLLKTAVGAAAVATTATAQAPKSSAPTGMKKKVYYRGEKPAKPLFSGAVSYGNLLFIAGKGAHVPGDIKKHTEIVLAEIKAELENAGSSMEKVIQARVFLDDLKDFAGMNEVFL